MNQLPCSKPPSPRTGPAVSTNAPPCKDALSRASRRRDNVITLLAMALHAGRQTCKAAADAFAGLTGAATGRRRILGQPRLMLRLAGPVCRSGRSAFGTRLTLAPHAPNDTAQLRPVAAGHGPRRPRPGIASSMRANSIRIPRTHGSMPRLACFECGDTRRAAALIPPPRDVAGAAMPNCGMTWPWP